MRERLEIANFCECGCKQIAKIGNRFVPGHNMRSSVNPNKGKKQTEDHKRKKGFQPGYEPSETTRKNQSDSATLRANKSENKEKFLKLMNSTEVKERRDLIDRTEIQKESHRKNPDRAKNHSKTMKGRKPWNDGLTKYDHPGIARRSEKLEGRKPWNDGLTKKNDSRIAKQGEKLSKQKVKTNCDNCGKELERLPKRINEKMNFCDRKCNAEWKSKNMLKEKNHVWVPRTELKCDWCGKKITRRPKKIKPTNFCSRKHADRFHARWVRERFLSLGDCFHNPIATKFFRKFDEDFQTEGHYADPENGKKEFRVIGYSLDYINLDLKLIIEWDEESHYDSKGNLRKRDVERQREIQEHFSDFGFVRIRQNEMLLGQPIVRTNGPVIPKGEIVFGRSLIDVKSNITIREEGDN